MYFGMPILTLPQFDSKTIQENRMKITYFIIFRQKWQGRGNLCSPTFTKENHSFI